MSKLVCIDTNVLIRFLRADHPQLSLKAKEIFFSAQKGKVKIYLDEIVAAEAVWLLSSFYKVKKEEIASQLQELVSQEWIVSPRKKIVLDSLSLYSSGSLAYIDCWVYCVSKDISGKLTTFDKKLKKLSDKTV